MFWCAANESTFQSGIWRSTQGLRVLHRVRETSMEMETKTQDMFITGVSEVNRWLDVLPDLSLTLAGLETGKEGNSYGIRLFTQPDRFGGFLLLTALPHRSLHRLTGHSPALHDSAWLRHGEAH